MNQCFLVLCLPLQLLFQQDPHEPNNQSLVFVLIDDRLELLLYEQQSVFVEATILKVQLPQWRLSLKTPHPSLDKNKVHLALPVLLKEMRHPVLVLLL